MSLPSHRLFFSSDYIFRRYWGGMPPSPEEIPLLLRVNKHQIDPHKPDGHHRSALESAFSPWQSPTLASMLRTSMKAIVDKHLTWEDSSLYVNCEHFPTWQETIGEIPAVPLLAYAIRSRVIERGGDETDLKHLAAKILSNSVQPSLRVPLLDDLIRHDGLHELHMHLSGTTEPDSVWQHALGSPYKAFHEFQISYSSQETIRELLLQVGLTDPIDIYHLVRLGALLRDSLAFALSGAQEGSDALPVCPYRERSEPRESTEVPASVPDPSKCLFGGTKAGKRKQKYNCNLRSSTDRCASFWTNPLTLQHLKSFLCTFRYSLLSQPLLARRIGEHPLAALEPRLGGLPPQVLETLMLCRAYDAVERGNNAVAAWLHAYLVVQARFFRFLVQQRNQVGFDQFQKIPDNKLRDPVEKEYAKRFRQLRGMYGQDLASIDFLPKKA